MRRNIKEEELRRYAYHEAGHALIILLRDCGKTLKSVSIKPSNSFGFFYYTSGKVTCENVQPQLSLAQAQNLMMCELAGEAAENIMAGTKGKAKRSATRDKKMAKKLAQNIAKETGAAVSDILKTAEEETYTVLEAHKDKLRALAEVLLEHGALGAAQVQKITT
jgi:ATP-dependent Zn protease